MLFRDNPFYILNISCIATRRQISEQVEELSLLDDSQEYQKAQACLFNPSKRLQAELAWVDVSEEERHALVGAIQKGTYYDYSAYSSYTKLNLVVYCFGISDNLEVNSLIHSVVDINAAYAALDTEEITDRINSIHESAGVHDCTIDEITDELQEMRYSVKKCILDKIKELSEEDYIEFASAIAQEAEKTFDSCILDDVIDGYAIELQPRIDAGFEEIKGKIAEITEHGIQPDLQGKVDSIIGLIKKWAVLIRPMQILTNEKGLTETNSKNLAHEVQDLLKYLNDAKKTELAVKAANEIKKELSNQNELSGQFEEISKVLSNNLAVAPLLKELDTLNNSIDVVKRTKSSSDINTVINKVYKLERLIRSSPLDKKEKDKLNSVVFLMARSLSVELYNDSRVSLACKLFYVLERLYKEDPQNGLIIIRDKLTISANPKAKKELAAQSPYFYSESPESIEKKRQQQIAQNTAQRETMSTIPSSSQSSKEGISIGKVFFGIALIIVVIAVITGIAVNSRETTTTTTATTRTVSHTAATTQAPTTVATTAAPTEAPHGQYYRVTADSLNVRDSKNRDTVVGTLSKGAIIEEIGSYENDNWVLFEMNGKKVVAYKEYLEKVSQSGN